MPQDINKIEKKLEEFNQDAEKEKGKYRDAVNYKGGNEGTKNNYDIKKRSLVSIGHIISYDPEHDNNFDKDADANIVSAKMEYENKKREAYLKQINDGREAKIDSFDNLSQEEKDAFTSFDLSPEEKKELFKGTVERIKNVEDARSILINGDENGELEEEINKLKAKENLSEKEKRDLEQKENQKKGFKGRYDEIKDEVNKQIEQFDKLEEQREKVEEEIAKIEEEITNAPEDKALAQKLEDKKAELKKILDERAPFLEKKDGKELTVIDRLRAIQAQIENENKIADMIDYSDHARLNAFNGLESVYGQELAYGDETKDIMPKTEKYKKEFEERKKKIAEKNGKDKDINKDKDIIKDKDDPKPKEDKNEIEEEDLDSSGSGDTETNTGNERDAAEENAPKTKNNVARTVAGPVIASNVIDQVANGKDSQPTNEEDEMIVDDEKEEQQREEQPVETTTTTPEKNVPVSYLEMLGYDPSKKLNVDRAETVLNNFLSKENKAKQIEMLKDPEASKVVIDSMSKISKNMNPFRCKQIRELQQNILNNGELKNRVAALYVKGDNVTSFETLKEEYVNGKENIDKELEKVKEEKGEDSKEYKDMADKVNSLSAVINFEDAAKENFYKGSPIQGFYNNYMNHYEYNNTKKLLPYESVSNLDSIKDIAKANEDGVSTINPEDLAKNIEKSAAERESRKVDNFMINEFGEQGLLSKSDAELEEMANEVRHKSMDSLMAELDSQEQIKSQENNGKDRE